MIATIAQREFGERIRSKLFLGINGFLIVVIAAAIILPAVIDREADALTVGVTDAQALAVVEVAGAQGGPDAPTYEAEEVSDRAAGEVALRDGEIDLLLVGATTLVAETGVGIRTETVFNAAARSVELEAALDDAGLSEERRAQLLGATPLAIEVLDEDRATAFGAEMLIVLVVVGLLYGLLIFHGQWLAQGIVEEKQSRVIEVLLSAVRPWQLLAGKVAGIGALGLAQVAVLAGTALVAMLAVDAVDIPPEIRGSIVFAVLWYLVGYTLYATLFTVSGALAARSEDLQATTAPVFVLLIAALFIAQAATADPRSTLATVSAFVPFTAPMVQPVRMAAGTISVVEIVTGIAIAITTIVVLMPVTGRLYRGGVLRTRTRVRLRDAWSSPTR